MESSLSENIATTSLADVNETANHAPSRSNNKVNAEVQTPSIIMRDRLMQTESIPTRNIHSQMPENMMHKKGVLTQTQLERNFATQTHNNPVARVTNNPLISSSIPSPAPTIQGSEVDQNLFHGAYRDPSHVQRNRRQPRISFPSSDSDSLPTDNEIIPPTLRRRIAHKTPRAIELLKKGRITNNRSPISPPKLQFHSRRSDENDQEMQLSQPVEVETRKAISYLKPAKLQFHSRRRSDDDDEEMPLSQAVEGETRKALTYLKPAKFNFISNNPDSSENRLRDEMEQGPSKPTVEDEDEDEEMKEINKYVDRALLSDKNAKKKFWMPYVDSKKAFIRSMKNNETKSSVKSIQSRISKSKHNSAVKDNKKDVDLDDIDIDIDDPLLSDRPYRDELPAKNFIRSRKSKPQSSSNFPLPNKINNRTIVNINRRKRSFQPEENPVTVELSKVGKAFKEPAYKKKRNRGPTKNIVVMSKNPNNLI